MRISYRWSRVFLFFFLKKTNGLFCCFIYNFFGQWFYLKSNSSFKKIRFTNIFIYPTRVQIVFQFVPISTHPIFQILAMFANADFFSLVTVWYYWSSSLNNCWSIAFINGMWISFTRAPHIIIPNKRYRIATIRKPSHISPIHSPMPIASAMPTKTMKPRRQQAQ